MSCKDRIEHVSAYVDGELTGAPRDAVEAHLETCGECARSAEEFRRLDDLAHRDPVPPVRGEEWAGVLRRVLAEGSRPEAARWAEADLDRPFQVIAAGGSGAERSAGTRARRWTRRGPVALAVAAALVVGAAALTIVLSPSEARRPGPETTTAVSPDSRETPVSPGPSSGPDARETEPDDYANRSTPPQPEIEEEPRDPLPEPPLEDL